MELAEDEIFEKYGKRCGNCNRKTLLPYEHEFTFLYCLWLQRKQTKASTQ